MSVERDKSLSPYSKKMYKQRIRLNCYQYNIILYYIERYKN